MSLLDMRLAVWPGPGLVQRAGDTVLVVLGDPQDEAMLESLCDLCRSRHGADLARALAGTVLGGEAEQLPDFAVVTSGADGLLTLCRGAVEVTAATGGGPVRVSGRGLVTWVEQALGEDVREVTIAAPGAPAAALRPWADLRSGVVPGGGATLLGVGVAPAPGVPAPPAAAPADRIGARETPPSGLTPPGLVPSDDPPPPPAPRPPDLPPAEFQAVLLEPEPERVAAREPLPVHAGDHAHEHDDEHAAAADGAVPAPVLVAGVRCSRGHHNNPAAVYCSSCGIRMGAHLTLNLVQGPRPPLGVLVFDDGSTIPVRHDMVIGREPAVDELARSGTALAIRVEDETSSVSRAHLHVILDGWDVLVADRGSSNGTFVRLKPDDDWRRLQPSERLRLVTGSEVRLGDRVVIFEQHHVS